MTDDAPPSDPTAADPTATDPTAADPTATAEAALRDPAFREEIAELTAGTAEVLPADGLATRLAQARVEGRPLRVKLGIDPSGTDLTLGHAVVLRKLRQFQDYGHTAVLIIGDFTGRVGDPTGRSEVRKVQSAEDTAANSATYLDQVQRILSPDNLEVRRNSEWLGSMDFSEVLGYTRLLTVARLLERDDFSKRYKAGQPISLMEFMYPLMQGLDSVFIDADVELGGTDQTYNNLVGRNLQSQLDRPAQTVVTLPLLRGTDGADKMGKSLNNYIAIGEPPDEQYGKVLSVSDELISHYAELCCGWNRSEVAALVERIATDPFGAKRAVAHRIVELYWGSDRADEAAARWTQRFSERTLVVEELPTHVLAGTADETVSLAAVLLDAGLVKSKGEARQLMKQGGIKVDGVKVEPDTEWRLLGDLVGTTLHRGRHVVRLVSP